MRLCIIRFQEQFFDVDRIFALKTGKHVGGSDHKLRVGILYHQVYPLCRISRIKGNITKPSLACTKEGKKRLCRTRHKDKRPSSY